MAVTGEMAATMERIRRACVRGEHEKRAMRYYCKPCNLYWQQGWVCPSCCQLGIVNPDAAKETK